MMTCSSGWKIRKERGNFKVPRSFDRKNKVSMGMIRIFFENVMKH